MDLDLLQATALAEALNATAHTLIEERTEIALELAALLRTEIEVSTFAAQIPDELV